LRVAFGIAFFSLGCATGPEPILPDEPAPAKPAPSVTEIATLPETPEPEPAPVPVRSAFAVGDRVSCNWKSGGTLYEGKVGELRSDGRLFIQYDDGDTEETTPDLCRLSQKVGNGPGGVMKVGDRVSCNWQSRGKFYAGRVGELRPAGRLFIQYDDGDTEETSPDLCRIIAKPTGPITATPGFGVGARVSCNWQNGGTFYDGTVSELRPDGRIFIKYDDGDVEETSPSMCRKLANAAAAKRFKIGARVSCNWKSGGTFYDGRVAELKSGGRIFIQYDDGDTEETTPALCRPLRIH
jgi:hypothetical protein